MFLILPLEFILTEVQEEEAASFSETFFQEVVMKGGVTRTGEHTHDSSPV